MQEKESEAGDDFLNIIFLDISLSFGRGSRLEKDDICVYVFLNVL